MLHRLADHRDPPATIAFDADGLENALFDWRIDQSDRPQRVAIVGAGLSGLVAGWLLKRAGHEITIFEATRRVGGRVRTLRAPFTGGLSAEAGSMRIPGHHRLTLGLAKGFGLDLVPFRNACDNTLVYLNGRRFRRGALPEDGRLLGFPLADGERGRSARDLFEEAIVRYLRGSGGVAGIDAASLFDPSARRQGPVKRSLEVLDRLSLGQFLRHATGLSAGAADYILALLSLEPHQTSSMAAVLGDHVEMNGSADFWQIRGGMDALTDAFVRKPSATAGVHASRPSALAAAPGRAGACPDLSADIVYGARLFELVDDRGGIRLRVQHAATREVEETVRFDRVIVSAPFSALSHVRFNGLASAEKCRAIRRLHYDNASKIFIEFDACFWLDGTADPIRGGHSITDRPVRTIGYPSHGAGDAPGQRAVLLASYTWGDDSLRWAALPHADRIRFALRDLEDVHGLRPGSLDRSCVGGAALGWGEQPSASGAVAMFEPHQLTTLFADVWRPEGRLHYCGEHTSGRHGWMEGAVESALRVAREVCGSIEKEVGSRHRAATAMASGGPS